VPDPLIDDLNHAFNELAAVTPSDGPSVRRKLAAYLDALYTLREYRSAQLKRAVGKQIWEPLVRKGHVVGGQQVEGHVVPRNNKVHHMIKMAPPATAPTYPGDRLTPSDYLYPGETSRGCDLTSLTSGRGGTFRTPTKTAISRIC
jgi:hypothetical protein